MENAEWPTTSVPGPIKKLIARFYELVDSEAPDCSDILATEVFVPDGKFVINKWEMMGTEQIKNWRVGGDALALRRHEVFKLYVCDEKASDLLMTGVLKLGTQDGHEAESTYCARCVVDDATSSTPRIKHWQGWVDTMPFLEIGLYSQLADHLRKKWDAA